MTEGIEPKLLETFNKKIKLSPETLKYMEAQDEHIKGGGSVEGLSMRDILKMNQYFDESEEFLSKLKRKKGNMKYILSNMRMSICELG